MRLEFCVLLPPDTASEAVLRGLMMLSGLDWFVSRGLVGAASDSVGSTAEFACSASGLSSIVLNAATRNGGRWGLEGWLG